MKIITLFILSVVMSACLCCMPKPLICPKDTEKSCIKVRECPKKVYPVGHCSPYACKCVPIAKRPPEQIPTDSFEKPANCPVGYQQICTNMPVMCFRAPCPPLIQCQCQKKSTIPDMCPKGQKWKCTSGIPKCQNGVCSVDQNCKCIKIAQPHPTPRDLCPPGAKRICYLLTSYPPKKVCRCQQTAPMEPVNFA